MKVFILFSLPSSCLLSVFRFIVLVTTTGRWNCSPNKDGLEWSNYKPLYQFNLVFKYNPLTLVVYKTIEWRFRDFFVKVVCKHLCISCVLYTEMLTLFMKWKCQRYKFDPSSRADVQTTKPTFSVILVIYGVGALACICPRHHPSLPWESPCLLSLSPPRRHSPTGGNI